jgi:hypothetical protein
MRSFCSRLAFYGVTGDIGRMCFPIQLTVNFAPVADTHHEDADQLVFNTGNDAVITNPVFPEIAELSSLEGLTNAARVLK